MFCNKCGFQISDDSSFCLQCGNPIIIPSQVQNQIVSVQTGVVPSTPQLSDEERKDIVNNLRSFAKNIRKLEDQVNRIEEETKFLKRPRKLTVSRFKAGMSLFIPGAIAGFLGLTFLFLGAVSRSGGSIGFGVFALIIGIMFLIPALTTSGTKQMEMQSFYDEQYESEMKRYKEKQLEIEKMCKQKDEMVFVLENSMVGIPEQYYYTEALDFFADRLISRRSNSMIEAMDAYDEYLHRLKLEDAAYAAAEYQKKSAENLASIKRATAINTAANVANVIRHW